MPQGFQTELSANRQYVYRLGLIDILSQFGTLKTAESSLKQMFNGVKEDDISCVDSVKYQERFMEFLKTHLWETGLFVIKNASGSDHSYNNLLKLF